MTRNNENERNLIGNTIWYSSLNVNLLNRHLRVGFSDERDESVAFRFVGAEVADDSAIGNLAERSEGVSERLGLDFGAQIADENVIVLRRVHLKGKT